MSYKIILSKMKLTLVFLAILLGCNAHDCSLSRMYVQSDIRAALTASTSHDSNHSPAQSALFSVIGAGSWSARTNDRNQWIQVDFRRTVTVGGVLLQGRGTTSYPQRITQFRVTFSTNGRTFYSTETLDGSLDIDTVQRRIFDVPMTGRYFRIIPVQWYQHISLRFDFLRC